MHTYCESCRVIGEWTEATTKSSNPDWSGYNLCEECAAEYNQRPPVNSCKNQVNEENITE